MAKKAESISKGTKGEAVKRIPLKPDTFDRLREFARGADYTYDEVIEVFLATVPGIENDALIAGREFAARVAATKRSPRNLENLPSGRE